MRAFLKSWTIRIDITKKPKSQDKKPDLFSEIVYKNVPKKFKHNDIRYYTEAYNVIETEMKLRAKSGCDMNEEFGYEIAHMKTQLDCENDILNIIGFSLVTVNFVQNLYSILSDEVDPSNKIWLILINILAMVLYAIFVMAHPSGSEGDKQRIVCLEILERLEKSKEFSAPFKDFYNATNDAPNTDDHLKGPIDMKK